MFKNSLKIVFVLLVLFFFFSTTNAHAQTAEYAPGEIIVKYKNDQSPRDLKEDVQRRVETAKRPIIGGIQNRVEDLTYRARGEKVPEEKLKDVTEADKKANVISVEEVIPSAPENTSQNLDDVHIIKTKETVSVEQLERIYEAIPEVEYAQPNYKVGISEVPNDPLYEAMWGLKKIKMEQAWDITKGSTDTTVAVVDTGIDYTHSELGASNVVDRNFTQVTQAPLQFEFGSSQLTIDQTFALDNNRLAYFSDNAIYVYSFTLGTATQINLPSSDLKPKRLAIKDNIIVYYAIGTDFNPALYFYNLTTSQHKKIVNTKGIGSIGISNGKIIYGRENRDPGYSSAIYLYDIATETESVITSLSTYMYMPKVSNNLIAYSVVGSSCYAKAVIYDLTTNQSRDIFPPDIGPILDFADGKILYVACSKTNFDGRWRTYYTYDVNTGTSKKLMYESQGFGGSDVASQDYYSISSWTNKGSLENGMVYFSKDANANRIVAYDENKNRYVLINLLKTSRFMDSDEERVCFLSNDFNIYCHTYNPNDSYSLPKNFFNNRVTSGYDFAEGDEDPLDGNGHGTHVAGTIGAIVNNNIGIAGINWDVKLMAVKVLNDYGSGTTADIIRGILYAADNGAKVINLSLGGFLGNSKSCPQDDQVTQNAVTYAWQKGVTVVVAAGNSNSDALHFTPASCNGVITVGSTGPTDQRAFYSNFGSVVDLAAPGGDSSVCNTQTCLINSTYLNNTYRLLAGTSMAAPHVAGVAALLIGRNPTLTPDQIETVLKTSGDAISTDQPIGKRLNAHRSLLAVTPITPTPAISPTPPTPSENGKIVFSSFPNTSYSDSEIYVMHPDGSSRSKLISRPNTWDSQSSFSFDGKKIAFVTYAPDGKNSIVISDYQGKLLNNMTLSSLTYLSYPLFTPDGNTLIFFGADETNNDAIYQISTDGSNLKTLIDEPDSAAPYAVSSDGTKLVYLRYEGGVGSASLYQKQGNQQKPIQSQGGGGNTEIYMANIDGTQRVNLTNTEDVFEDAPTLLPNGQSIIFSIWNNNYDLYRLDIADRKVTRITNTPALNENMPSVSPDGTKIVFVSYNTTDYISHIYTMNLDGSNQQQMTSDNTNYDYLGSHAWAIDPEHIPAPSPTPTSTPIPPTATPTPVPGDINKDNKADLEDFTIWKNEFSQPPTTKTADLNNDGKVDLLDYSVWRNEYGKG